MLLDDGESCESEGYLYITNITNCSAAAAELNLGDTSASSDEQDGVYYDPPYCYYEGGLKFGGSTSYGPCSTSDNCLCVVRNNAILQFDKRMNLCKYI